jgi:hypothetical protein
MVGAGSLGHWGGGRQPGGSGRPARADGRGCIGEELPRGAWAPGRLAVSLRAVAETLLEQTNHANANSAEVALRTRAQARSGCPRAQARRPCPRRLSGAGR